MAKRSLALLLTCLGALLAMPVMASADTEDIIEPQNETPFQGFQAGTCTTNDIAGPPPEECSVDTPEVFFTQAAGHPPVGFTQYVIQHDEEGGAEKNRRTAG